jgi:hypothetical protein
MFARRLFFLVALALVLVLSVKARYRAFISSVDVAASGQKDTDSHTNGERLRLGLPPKPPRRLYGENPRGM